MLTVVVHYDETPQDWNLVERFFHIGISSGKLAFFQHNHKQKGAAAYKELQQSVLEYIRLRMIDQWQIVWLMNVPSERGYQMRISSQLHLFRTRFLNGFYDKNTPPQRIFVMALDGIDRDDDGAPKSDSGKRLWELDLHGYLVERPESDTKNLFHLSEIQALDAIWGSPMELQEAGLLEHPKEEFLAELERRVDAVLAGALQLIDTKKQIAQQFESSGGETALFDIVPVALLERIAEDFSRRLQRLRKLPLTQDLDKFKPAELLKEAVTRHLGMKSSLSACAFIRVPLPQHSPVLRIKALLKICYAVNAFSTNTPAVRLLQGDHAYSLDVIFRESDLHAMINHHLTGLYLCRAKVEDALMERKQETSPEYGEWNSLPHALEAYDEPAGVSLVFNYKRRRQFEQDFRSFALHAGEVMKSRDELSITMAKEGMRKLDIHKLQKDQPIGIKNIEIQDVVRKMTEQSAAAREHILQLSPDVPRAFPLWEKQMKQAHQEMSFWLRTCPGLRQTAWLSLFVILLFMLPYLQQLKELEFMPATEWMTTYGIYPASCSVVLAGCAALSRRAITRAIRSIARDAKQQYQRLLDTQKQTQKKYMDYLNHLFKLIKLRRRLQNVLQFGENRRVENLQLRYHHAALEDAIEAAKKLAKLLNCPVQEAQGAAEGWHDEQTWFTCDEIQHPVYCPLSSAPQAGTPENDAVDLTVGVSKDTLRDPLLFPAAKIQFLHDRVYRI